MDDNIIKCVQINLHHAKAAAYNFDQAFRTKGFKVGLIQEPYVTKNNLDKSRNYYIRGISGAQVLYTDRRTNLP